ncbi:hypothetical protein [Allorhodopirellula heiligendammensis]|uniref:Uncharacterized protein n=1 Tax=Allorhodopirellula heiligendammensis TaxID=2714739 RepID=A0A5C6BT17_9BACT|nr:hypothetical protein [Allorhodopirellula heiligendammensis]TWU15115.1 hypothetical protein Poly21_23070 [Allorhodopirellula heiligendammensis]
MTPFCTSVRLLAACTIIAAVGDRVWSQTPGGLPPSLSDRTLYQVCDDTGTIACDAMAGSVDGEISGSCDDDGSHDSSAAQGATGHLGNYASDGNFVSYDCPPQDRLPGYEELSSRNWLRLNTPLTDAMLDFQNRQTDKELFILEYYAAHHFEGPQVIVGGQSRLSLLAASTNRTNKFPYLGRFPTDFRGDSATDARMLQANSQATAQFTSYASVYTELLFSDVFSFAAPKQGSLQVRQAYAIVGDLRVSPLYLFIGKKNVGFGDLSTLSPFTQAVPWHYFASLAEGIGAGYHDDHWDFTLAGINGGRGIRTVDSPELGKLNNLAANVSFRVGDTPDYHLRVGGGFLLGTIYDSNVAEHVNPMIYGEHYNSAWDINARLDIDRLTLAGEYVTTTGDWPVTSHRVSAYRTEAAYWFDRGSRGSNLSVSWSSGIQGPAGSEYEFNDQLVLGYGKRLGPNFRVSAEYVRSTGFAPLIDITTVSDRDVIQNSLVLGMTLLL